MGNTKRTMRRCALAGICLCLLLSLACALGVQSFSAMQPALAFAEDAGTTASQESAAQNEEQSSNQSQTQDNTAINDETSTSAKSQSPATQHKTVKVAWFNMPDYQQTSSDGTRYGYVFDYLQMLSQYTGWDYEFVDVEGFDDGYNKVVSGELDLMGCVFYNDTRAQQVDFPELGIGIANTSLYVSEDSPIASDDFENFSGLRVGVYSEENAARLQKYSTSEGFSVVPVFYDSPEAVRKAVLSGEIDAGMQGGYRNDGQTRSIAVFDPDEFYLITTKTDPTLVAGLNEGLSQLKIDNPFVDSQLLAKHAQSYGKNVVLTRNESDYISSHGPIKVALSSSWAPIETYDERTQSFAGMVSRIFNLISERTGLTFEYVRASSNEDAEEMLRTGQVDLNASMEHYYPAAQEKGLLLSDVYLSIPMVVADSPSNTGEENTLAIPSFVYSAEEMFGNSYRITYYDTPQDCFDAINTNKTGLAAVNSYSAEYLKSKTRYSSIQLASYNSTLDLCAAISKDTDSTLLSILDKGINSLSDADKTDIITSEAIGAQKITMQSLLTRIPVGAVLAILATLVAIIIALTLLVRSYVKNNRKIRQLLYNDSLTPLLSYQGFLQNAKSLIADHPDRNYCVISVDVDFFGRFNAIQGFKAGNKMLDEIAKTLQSDLNEDEIAARVFADNFLLLVQNDCNEDLRARIAALYKKLCALHEMRIVSYSFGIYEITDRTLPVSLMCDRATSAKSQVKGLFNEYCAFFDKNEDTRQIQAAKLAQKMEESLSAGEFKAYYQPKCSPATMQITGAEALVRWIRKDGDVVLPGDFIPAFEDNGMVCRIDLFMLETVCEYQRRALDAGRKTVPISSNFSRMHLRNTDFPENVRDLVDGYNIPHHLIQVEFTESSFIDSKEALSKAMAKLSDWGFTLAMDDFGSGLSSLNMLKEYSFDVLKIDQGFLRKAKSTDKSNAILESIVAMAHKLHLSVVVEGVETQSQFQLVKSLGCDAIQGYYFARPMPEEDFRAMLAGASDAAGSNDTSTAGETTAPSDIANKS